MTPPLPSSRPSSSSPSLSAELPAGVRRGSPEFRRINGALFLAGFATFSLVYCVQPMLPMLAETFALTASQSSLAVSLTTASLAVSIVLAGALSEAVGRKGLMAASICAGAVLMLVAAVAPQWSLLLMARGFAGVVLGGVPAVAMAYLAEEMDSRDLGAAMGQYVGGTALGGMSGRVVVGAVSEMFSWRVGLATIAVAGLLCAVGFWLLLPPSRRFVRRPGLNLRFHCSAWAGHLRQAALRRLFALGFLGMGMFVTVYNYIGFLLLQPPYSLSHTQIGLIFTAYLFGVVGSSWAGKLADRLGRATVLLGGQACTAFGLLLSVIPSFGPSFWPSFWPMPWGLGMVICGLVLLTTGFFIAHSVASGWVGRLALHSKGHAASLYLLAYYVGSSTMGTMGGSFWDHLGWPGVVAFTLALLAVALKISLPLRSIKT